MLAVDLGSLVNECSAMDLTLLPAILDQYLVKKTKDRVGCNAVVADYMELTRTFDREAFDCVLSSECI